MRIEYLILKIENLSQCSVVKRVSVKSVQVSASQWLIFGKGNSKFDVTSNLNGGE